MATSRLSAVHRGAAFEHRSLQLLQAYFSMALRRVGGRSDGGVDLVGWWWLPFASESDPAHRPGALADPNGLLRRRLRVLAQCKAEKKKFSPKYVREMEGVWHIHTSPSAQRAAHASYTSEAIIADMYPTVALLISESPFSKSTILNAYQSAVPFLLIHLPCSLSLETSTWTLTGDPGLGTVCPNPALTHLVKPLAFRWERDPSTGHKTEKDVHMGGRPGLWWQGRKLGSWAPEVLDPDTTPSYSE